MIFFCYTYVYLGILYYIFFIYVWVFPAMNDEEIERLLNGSDFDFSEDDDEDEYLSSEFLQNIYKLEESDEEQEERPPQQHTGELVQSSSRLFWRTKEILSRGPDIADDILLSQGTSKINMLYSFF